MKRLLQLNKKKSAVEIAISNANDKKKCCAVPFKLHAK